MAINQALSGGGTQLPNSGQNVLNQQGIAGLSVFPGAVVFDQFGLELTRYPTWSATPTYPAFTVVLGSDNQYYYSLSTTTNNNPTTDGGVHWVVVIIPRGGTVNGQTYRYDSATKSILPSSLFINDGSTLSAATSLDMAANKITSTYAPVNGPDLTNKTYVDSIAVSGITDAHPAVQLVSTTNIASLSGEKTIDGTLTSASRVALVGQSTASQNGFWVTAAGAWTRAADAPNAGTTQIVKGSFFLVTNGTSFAGSGWICTTSGTITIGTTGQTWIELSAPIALVAGNGIAISGTTISVDNSALLTFTGNKLTIANTAVTPASYGSGTSIPNFTVDAQGRLTAAGSTSIAASLLPTGTDKQLVVNQSGTWAAVTASGDVTVSANTGTLSLKNTGTAQTIGDATHTLTQTTDAQGRVTATTANDISAKLLPTGTNNQVLTNNAGSWQAVALSGDATILASGALTLASTIVAGGPTGSTTVVPVITYDAKGRLTAVTTASIAGTVPNGTAAGQLLYWNGSAWVADTAGANTNTIAFVGTVPTPTSYLATDIANSRVVIGAPVAPISGPIFQVHGTGGTGNPTLAAIYERGSAANAISFQVLNANNSKGIEIGYVGATNDFWSGTAQGDAIIRQAGGAGRIQFGIATTGLAALDSTGLVVGGVGAAGAKLDVTAGAGIAGQFTGVAGQVGVNVVGATGSTTIGALTVTNDKNLLANFTNTEAHGSGAGASLGLWAGTTPTVTADRVAGLFFGKNVSGTLTTLGSVGVFTEEDVTTNHGIRMDFVLGTTGAATNTTRVKFRGNGDVVFNASGSAIATSATGGFTWLPNCAGTPSGTPTNTHTGATPTIWDSTHKTLWAWDGAAWISVDNRVPVTLTDAATIATDASLGKHFRVTLGGNRTMGAPTNPTDGQKILYEIIQDGTGTRTLAWNAIFVFGTDVASPTLTTTINKRDFVGFVYNGAASKWYGLAVARGY